MIESRWRDRHVRAPTQKSCRIMHWLNATAFLLQTIFLISVMVEVVGQAFDDAFSEVLLLGVGV